jgi:peptidoglycan/xylan/chitin deacetylase (PgdA/CDA1 family)
MRKSIALILCVFTAAFFLQGSTYVQSQSKVTLPIIMYHQLSKTRQSRYVVSQKSFESDMEELYKRGYTTVWPSELVSFVETGRPLPSKPILITFDDGHYNNVYYGEDILKKYGAKATINVIGKYMDNTEKIGDLNPRYSYFTWERLRNINRDIFEVGNHTYDMHNFNPRRGMGKLSRETDAAYRTAVKEDIHKMQRLLREKSDFEAICFSYPFGIITKTAREVLFEEGIKVTFNCSEKLNYISAGDGDALKRLNRYNRDGRYSSAKFFNLFDK